MMDYDPVIDYLYNKLDYGVFLGLERIKKILKLVGNPEKDLKIIHVAGTNGKGSVCAMISQILKTAGYKAGMYTSPHLTDFRERFQIDNINITEEKTVRYFKIIKPHINEVKPSFFEAITAMALLYFKEEKVDYLVMEVGLGGRLDATNTVKPIISVITNISIEHTDYLGDTVESISKEKAGIIKKDGILVSGAKGKSRQIIEDICMQKDCRLVIQKKKHKTNLKGAFQKDNAGIAAAVANELNITDQIIVDGLMNVKWPGRLEFIEKNVLIDCAHNPAAVNELVKYVKKLKYEKLIVVLGILDDKDTAKMTCILKKVADQFILTQPGIKRAIDPEIIAKNIEDSVIIKDAKKAFSHAKEKAGKNDLILVTGSIYLVGEILGCRFSQ